MSESNLSVAVSQQMVAGDRRFCQNRQTWSMDIGGGLSEIRWYCEVENRQIMYDYDLDQTIRYAFCDCVA